EVGREQKRLIQFLHHRFEAEHRVYGVADNGGVTLRVESDVSTGDGTVVQRNPDTKRLPAGPLHLLGECKQVTRNSEGCRTIRRLTIATAPVSEHGVTNEFVDRPTAPGHEVARFPKPRTKLMREITARNFFRHRAEASNVAD